MARFSESTISDFGRRCRRFSVGTSINWNWRFRRIWSQNRRNPILFGILVFVLFLACLYLLSVTKTKQSTLLCVAILSSPSSEGIQKRSACRESWLTLRPVEKSSVKSFFFIGQPKEAGEPEHSIASLRAELREEQSLYGDIVTLPLEDHYTNLTLKVIQAIKYLADNERCEYIMKADDDTFARLDLLAAELSNIKLDKWLYWGYFTGRASVYHKGRWAENNWFLCDRYLPYARGGGYIFSGGLGKFIADSANMWERYVNEDVSFGVWTSGVILKRVHDPRFDTEYLSRGCLNSYLVTHKQKPEDMRRKIDNLRNTGQLCAVEGETRQGYEYDWKLPPTQCCDQPYKESRQKGGDDQQRLDHR